MEGQITLEQYNFEVCLERMINKYIIYKDRGLEDKEAFELACDALPLIRNLYMDTYDLGVVRSQFEMMFKSGLLKGKEHE